MSRRAQTPEEEKAEALAIARIQFFNILRPELDEAISFLAKFKACGLAEPYHLAVAAPLAALHKALFDWQETEKEFFDEDSGENDENI